MLRGIVIGIIVCTWQWMLPASQRAAGQQVDRLLDHLPAEPAIYVWTDDVATLAERLIEADLIRAGDWSSAWDYPAHWTHAREFFKQSHAPERQDAFEQLLDIVDEDLFYGHAVWIRYTHTPWHTTDAFAVQCSLERDEIAALIAIVNRIVDPRRPTFDGAELSDDSQLLGSNDNDDPDALIVDTLGFIPGFWACENGWFVWSERIIDLRRIASIARGDMAAVTPVTESRAFETVFRNLDAPDEEDALISFYIPLEAWPTISGWGIRMRADNFEDIYAPIWQGIVHDVRGLGGHVRRNSSPVSETDSLIVFDSFALIPEPRTEFLGALKPIDDRDGDLPFLPESMGVYLDVGLDGSRYEASVDQFVERAERLPDDVTQLRVKYLHLAAASDNVPTGVTERVIEKSPEPLRQLSPLMRPSDRFLFIASEVDADRFHSPLRRFDPFLYFHAPSHREATQAIDEYTFGDTGLTVPNRLFGALQWAPDVDPNDDAVTWNATDESRMAQISRMLEHLEAQESLLEDQRKTMNGDEARLAEFDDRVERMMESYRLTQIGPCIDAADSFWFAKEGWYSAHPIHPGYRSRFDDARDPRRHPQIEALRDSIEELQSHAQGLDEPIAVIGIWSSHLKIVLGITDGTDEEGRTYDAEALYMPDGHTVSDQGITAAINFHRKTKLTEMMLSRFDRIVAVVVDEPRGLRTTGGVFRNRTEASHEHLESGRQ